ncbi:hypothetical protein HYH03_010433 [Edaphochlamys debaryana]|uniref:Uncharacterized protein n=1 Tax=Edaphochlamys debaryana TaxID=47281 RepID=A0A835Y283_9CHLO|nr:hypothetical protein HYH03_010433 [Edaphochlamys debaryana]|eukprot:KAG2491225.1 hypothetical protein HYH03_010433 [Edaphochlamys debaryana]
MPPQAPVVIGGAVAAAALGYQVYNWGVAKADEYERQMLEREAEKQEELRKAWQERRVAEEEQRRHKEAKKSKADEGQHPLNKLMAHAQGQMQLRLADAFDDLDARLRACGVGASVLPLPGTPNPDRLVAVAALMFGSLGWEVLRPQRTSAIMTLGGTLATIPPAAASVMVAWLEGLAGRGADGEGDVDVAGPEAEAMRLSKGTLALLLSILTDGLESHPLGAGPMQPWVVLMPLPAADIEPLAEVCIGMLPGVRLLPYVFAEHDMQSVGKKALQRGVQPGLIIKASARPFRSKGVLIEEPGKRFVMLAVCVDGPEVEFRVSAQELKLHSPRRLGSRAPPRDAPGREKVAAALAGVLSSVLLCRAASIALRRVESSLGGAGGLAGCGWEHAAALAGEAVSGQCIQVLEEQHDAWQQISSSLQSDEQQRRTLGVLKARLMQIVPPPETPLAAKEGGGGKGKGGGDGRQGALEAEVDQFLSDLMPLTYARYLVTPRSWGGSGKLPEDVVPAATNRAEMLEGLAEMLPESASARSNLRTARLSRSDELAASSRPPAWLPGALMLFLALVIAVLMWGLAHGATAAVGAYFPQLSASLLDWLEHAAALVLHPLHLLALRLLPAWARWACWGLWRFALWSMPLWLWGSAGGAAVWAVRHRGEAGAWEVLERNVCEKFRLQLFQGRYHLPRLQERVDRQQAVWAGRIAAAKVAEAAARGDISRSDLRSVVTALQASAADSGSGSTGALEIVLPGPSQQAEAFLRARVWEDGGGSGAGGGGAGRGGAGAEGWDTEEPEVELLLDCMYGRVRTPVPLLEAPPGQGGGGAGASGGAASSGRGPGGGSGSRAPPRGGRTVDEALEQDGWFLHRRGSSIALQRRPGRSAAPRAAPARGPTAADFASTAARLTAMRHGNLNAEMKATFAAQVAMPMAVAQAGFEMGRGGGGGGLRALPGPPGAGKAGKAAHGGEWEGVEGDWVEEDEDEEDDDEGEWEEEEEEEGPSAKRR